MEQQPDSVETIVLSTHPPARQLTPAEAHCVARIRARRKRLQASLVPSANRIRNRRLAFFVTLVLVLVLVAVLLL